MNMDMTLAQIFEKAVMNTLLGMGTVFSVLIFISLLISLFAYIPRLQKMFSRQPVMPPVSDMPAATQAPTEHSSVVVEAEPGGQELVAVIAAAIAACEGTSPEGLVIRSIKRAGKQHR